MNAQILDCFVEAVRDRNVDLTHSNQKSDAVIRRESTVFMKQVELLLEHFLEQDLEHLTLNDLYNEISGQAHQR